MTRNLTCVPVLSMFPSALLTFCSALLLFRSVHLFSCVASVYGKLHKKSNRKIIKKQTNYLNSIFAIRRKICDVNCRADY